MRKEASCISLSAAGKGLRRKGGGGDLANLQYNPTWNCHNISLLYNKNSLIKINEKKNPF
jgi:hypothetical protein